MVEIKPLKAVVYNQSKVDLKQVIAPPYDVINNDYQADLYNRSPYNVIRLILNRGDKPYEDAKTNFIEWLNKDILINYPKPCILYLIQRYKNNNGLIIERKGFIARNKIEEFSNGNIVPHEYTMQGPKTDRLNLVTKTGAFFSQIFMVYQDNEQTIERQVYSKYINKKPYMDVYEDNNVQNIVYMIEDENDIKTIQNVMQNKKLLIADGHHRYETAMNYSNLHKQNENAQYVMSYYTNSADKNLVIYPTHRIIEKSLSKEFIIEKISKYYDVEITLSRKDFLEKIEEENKKQITTGLIIKNDSNFYILKLKPQMQESINQPLELQNLDLTVLHELILKNEFGYTNEELMAQDGIKYEKQEEIAFNSIKDKASACFIMAYPQIEEINKISNAGYRMPQKSTYFYPKLLSGIVINMLNDKGDN